MNIEFILGVFMVMFALSSVAGVIIYSLGWRLSLLIVFISLLFSGFFISGIELIKGSL